MLIENEGGAVLAKTPMHGFGNGPQLGFSPGILLPLLSASDASYFQGGISTAIYLGADAAGHVLISGVDMSSNYVISELPAGGGPLTVLPFSTGFDASFAYGPGSGTVIDAAGDIFVVDAQGSQLYEFPAGGGKPIELADGSGVDGDLFAPTLAVDDAGDVFFFSGLTLYELPAGGSSLTIIPYPTVLSEFTIGGLAVDGAGDIFLDGNTPSSADEFLELPVGGAGWITLPGTETPWNRVDNDGRWDRQFIL